MFKVPKRLDPELAKQVGEYLRKWRKLRKMSINEVSRLMRIKAKDLREIEDGTGEVLEATVYRLNMLYDICIFKIPELVTTWNRQKKEVEEKSLRRRHLCVVGDDPKPWERLRN